MDPLVKDIRDRNISYAISKWTGIPTPKMKKELPLVEEKSPEIKQEYSFYYSYSLIELNPQWTMVKKMSDGLYNELLIGQKIYDNDKTKPSYTAPNNSSYARGVFNYETGHMDLKDMGGSLYRLKSEMKDVVRILDLTDKYKKWFNLSFIDSLQQSMDTKVNTPFEYTQVSLDKECSEYKLLADFFNTRSYVYSPYIYNIDSIRKINHPVRARKYMFERETSEDNTEALLFHGSKASDNDVLSGGLDWRHSMKGNSGRAIYVSNSVDYSHGYTSTSTLYLVQSLIGKIHKQGSPIALSSPPGGYNSVHHTQNNPDNASEIVDIFALYSNDCTFITHAIDYTKKRK